MNAPWNNEDLRRAFDADFDALVAFASRSKARVGFAFLRADGQVDLGRRAYQRAHDPRLRPRADARH